MGKLIQLEDVFFQYPNTSQFILNGLSLDIYEKEFIAILGPNGSGKSTLAKLLNGILLPTSGKVTFENIETTYAEHNKWYIHENVGIVFQNPDNQIIATTVEDDVAFGLENKGISPKKIRWLVDEALETIGLTSYKLMEPHYLSGGQKQKLAIAGILAMKPKVIIFDESTSMLDPASKKDMMNVIKLLNEQEDITIIYITHTLEEAFLANRVIVLQEGSLFFDGQPSNILTDRDRLKKIGLEVPFFVELAFRLKERGLLLNDYLSNDEELIEELWKLT